MNEVINAILTRRSVRAFQDKPIKKEDLDAILKCAAYAPSAMYTQNWHFTAIRDAAFIEKVDGWIVSEIKESGNPNLWSVSYSTPKLPFPPPPPWTSASHQAGPRWRSSKRPSVLLSRKS